MSRASGKHTGRPAKLTPAQDREYGLEPERDIPGGETHLVNRQVIRQDVPAPEPLAKFRGDMAHGVPPHEFTDRADRDDARRPAAPSYAELPPARPAIPVVIVEEAGGSRALRSAAPRAITVNASTGEAVRLCGKDPARRNLLLLNESASHDVRIGQRPGDVGNGAGALLAQGATSYLRLETQDEIWAVSADSGTPAVSVIEEFELPGRG